MLVKVVVGLQQDDVLASLGLLVVELQNSLQVLLLKVLLLKLHYDLVPFFQLLKALHEHSQVLSDFFCRFRLNLTGNAFEISKLALTESFEELLVIRESPIVEACFEHGLVLALQVIWH